VGKHGRCSGLRRRAGKPSPHHHPTTTSLYSALHACITRTTWFSCFFTPPRTHYTIQFLPAISSVAHLSRLRHTFALPATPHTHHTTCAAVLRPTPLLLPAPIFTPHGRTASKARRAGPNATSTVLWGSLYLWFHHTPATVHHLCPTHTQLAALRSSPNAAGLPPCLLRGHATSSFCFFDSLCLAALDLPSPYAMPRHPTLPHPHCLTLPDAHWDNATPPHTCYLPRTSPKHDHYCCNLRIL